jgi:uncharacterized coiled-coil DUF342 family protein
MTEIIEKDRLIEQVIEKHRNFLETFNTEFSELDGKLNSFKQQSDALKKQIETTVSRIEVLNEKYHLLFYQAKKQREDIYNEIIEKMRVARSENLQDAVRSGSRVEDQEKRLQNSKNIDDEERMIVELKKQFYDIESAARKAGLIITFKGIIDKLNEANMAHKELLSLQSKPEENNAASKEQDKQINEIEQRHSWLKHRLDSHNNALAYWEKQKGGINVA